MSVRKKGAVTIPFVDVELNTPDPKKAKEIYSKLFQWQLEMYQIPQRLMVSIP